jgi:hypothetical protein
LFLSMEGHRRRGQARVVVLLLAPFLLTAAAGGALWMIYNAIRFGDPTVVGYSPRFSAEGYAAFVIAPAASVFLFCPLAPLWIAGLIKAGARKAGVILLLALPLVTAYLFYGALRDWPGGRSYGPRYLVPFLVLLAPGLALLLQSKTITRRAAIAMILAAAVMQLPGVLLDYSKVSVDWARSASAEDVADRNWRLASSPLVLNAGAVARAVQENAAYLTGSKPLPDLSGAAPDDDREFSQRFSFSLDFWWLYLVYMRAISRLTAVALAAGLALVCVTTAWVVWSDTVNPPHVVHNLPPA